MGQVRSKSNYDKEILLQMARECLPTFIYNLSDRFREVNDYLGLTVVIISRLSSRLQQLEIIMIYYHFRHV